MKNEIDTFPSETILRAICILMGLQGALKCTMTSLPALPYKGTRDNMSLQMYT